MTAKKGFNFPWHIKKRKDWEKGKKVVQKIKSEQPLWWKIYEECRDIGKDFTVPDIQNRLRHLKPGSIQGYISKFYRTGVIELVGSDDWHSTYRLKKEFDFPELKKIINSGRKYSKTRILKHKRKTGFKAKIRQFVENAKENFTSKDVLRGIGMRSSSDKRRYVVAVLRNEYVNHGLLETVGSSGNSNIYSIVDGVRKPIVKQTKRNELFSMDDLKAAKELKEFLTKWPNVRLETMMQLLENGLI